MPFNRLACYDFMDLIGRQETKGSETKDNLLLVASNESSQSISVFIIIIIVLLIQFLPDDIYEECQITLAHATDCLTGILKLVNLNLL